MGLKDTKRPNRFEDIYEFYGWCLKHKDYGPFKAVLEGAEKRDEDGLLVGEQDSHLVIEEEARKE